MKVKSRSTSAIIILFLLSLLSVVSFTHPVKATSVVIQTATLGPTLTPTSTATPEPSLIPAGTLPAEIVTPSAEPERYRLKTLSEAEMVAAVEEAWQYVDNYNVPAPYKYNDYREYSILLQKEILRRFPDLQNWETLYQDLVLRRRPDPFLFDDFIHIAEEVLNSDRIESTAALEDLLQAYNFTVDRDRAANLFGDEQIVEVWRIGAEDMLGMFLILSRTKQGDYQLTPVEGEWYASDLRRNETISIQDHNGNGRPEITLIDVTHGHTACISKIFLYEWIENYPDGQFINLVPAEAEVWGGYLDHSCENVWSFEPSNSTEAQSIIQTVSYHNWAGNDCSPYQVKTYYRSSGVTYEVTESKVVVPFDSTQPPHCAVGWADWAIKSGLQPDQAILLLEDVLANWAPELNEIWGPSGEDYLRFKLGTWLAQQGQIESARKVLEIVRDIPTNSEFDLASLLARAFLREYDLQQDPEAACWAAVQVAYSHLPDNLDTSEAVVRRMKETWGFAEPIWASFDYWLVRSLPEKLCQTQVTPPIDRFKKLVGQFGARNKADLVATLRAEDIVIEDLVQGDLRGNSVDDWVILVIDQKYKLSQVWALLQQQDELTTTVIVPDSSLANSIHPPAKLQSVRLDDSSPPLNFLELKKNGLVVFYIDQLASSLQAKILINNWGIEQYELDLGVEPPELRLEDAITGRISTLTWDVMTRRFISRGVVSDQQRREAYNQAEETLVLLEEMLFDFTNPTQTINLPSDLPTVDQFASVGYYIKGTYPPETHVPYLIGLAYELAGDEAKAVQTYWQLWHDYPNSPYSLMARRKLKLVGP